MGGGEALLNPEITDIIRTCREIFPDSFMDLGTNGLLLTRMNDSFFNALKDTNTTVVVSGYPPTMERWKEIELYLKGKGIRYRVHEVGKFFKRTDFSGNNKGQFRTCGSRVCHTVVNGCYAPCYLPISMPILNRHFGTAYDVSDSIYDLYDTSLTLQTFSRNIKSEVPACRYCGKKELHDWSVYDRSNDTIETWGFNA